jgi:hypothetical protein
MLVAGPALAAAPQPAADPAKPISVTLPLADWQAVVNSVGDSARISARDANRIAQSIVGQVQVQIAPPQPAKK